MAAQIASSRSVAAAGQASAGRGAGRLDRLTLVAFVIAVVVLGVNFVAIRFSNRELDPFWGAGFRFTIASLLLFGLVAWQRIALPRGAALVGVVLYGLLNFAAMYGFTYWGMLHVSAGTASVVFATIPLTTLLLAALFGLERLSLRGMAGAVTVLAGFGVVFYEQLQAAVPLDSLLALFLGSLCAAGAVIVLKRFPKANPFVTNAVGMGVGAFLLLLTSLAAAETPRLPELGATWLALGWLVSSSIIGFVLMVWILSRWTASATSYMAVLLPLVAVSAGSLLAGEVVSPVFLLGGVVVLFGVYLGALTTQTGDAGQQR